MLEKKRWIAVLLGAALVAAGGLGVWHWRRPGAGEAGRAGSGPATDPAANVLLITLDKRERKAYYDMLERTQKLSMEVTEWLAWFLDGRRNVAPADRERLGLLQASYYGLMNEVDDNLARLFAMLKESGDWKDTLIVLTSDHGEQMGDHWMLGKAGYFDQSYHVPLFVRDPDARADGTRGRIFDAFTEHVDLMPTLLDWIGLPAPRQCDGRSLLPLVRTGAVPADWRDAVHWEFDFRDPVFGAAEDALGLHMDPPE